MNIQMKDGQYSLIIEILEVSIDALIACESIQALGIKRDDIQINDGFDGDPSNPKYCEIGFTCESIHAVLKDLALANIDADIQILPIALLDEWTVRNNAYIRSGTININSKSDDNAAYELSCLKAELNKLGNFSADESINARINALHPYGWITTGSATTPT